MSRSPQAISSAAVRRHLEAAGPTVAQVLAAVTTEGAPPADIQPLVDHVEQTKRWALESGSRQAAWLLYMAARSCLAQIPEYARETEFTGLPPGRTQDHLEKHRVVARRSNALGATWSGVAESRWQAAPHVLAAECVELAEAIRPEWGWLALQKSAVKLAKGEYTCAADVLREKLDDAASDDLRYWLNRDLLALGLLLEGLSDERDRLDEILSLAPGDRLVPFFEMGWCAAQGDLAGLGAASEQLRSAEQSPAGHPAELLISQALPYLASRVGCTIDELSRLIGGGS